MPVFAALLRSVNVGRNRLTMDELRAVVTAAGFDEVATYLQSGNAVFRGRGTTKAAGRAIEGRMAADLGWSVPVIVRSSSQLRGVLSAQPFSHDELDPKTLHVSFLDGEPDRVTADRLGAETAQTGGDRAVVVGHEVYLHCPGGYGRTKLHNASIERRLGCTATTRNWRTVTSLAGMAGIAVRGS